MHQLLTAIYTQTVNQHLNITERETVRTKHTRSDEQQFQQHQFCARAVSSGLTTL